jgi:hypothetical protein
MTNFAARTKVPIEKTKMELERLVRRYGAKGFIAGWQGQNGVVEFLAHERHLRFSVTILNSDSDQAGRQKWRALLLVIKAKLESVDAKIVTFEQAFVGDIVMPGGKTVWEQIHEPIRLAYQGKNVALLESPR